MTDPTHGLELGVAIGYLTLQQAATIKGCSTNTMRNRVRSGEIPLYWLDQRTPLVRMTDVDAVRVRGQDKAPDAAGHAQ